MIKSNLFYFALFLNYVSGIKKCISCLEAGGDTARENLRQSMYFLIEFSS